MQLAKKHYQPGLTYQKAMELEWDWIMDLEKLENQSADERKSSVRFIEDGGYIVGQPKDENPITHVGIYRKLLKNLPVDETLTPENAESRGYEFVGDAMYDREAPLQAMQRIIHLVERKGYKLGQSASTIASDTFQGLYAPLKKKAQSKAV